MSDKIDILAIDDDKFVQKMIARALNSDSILVRAAVCGEQGVDLANHTVPDIILLDVEMPGINGYETCERLRSNPVTQQVPIIFLSSHSSLRERMQGYEVGGDDYLVKPFENENLQARVKILIKYKNERISLLEQYKLAQKTAVEALTGTSELGLAMRFMEKSIAYETTEELMSGLFEGIERLELNCCAMVQNKLGFSWHTLKEAISPIEKELLELADKDSRFLDFGQRTIVNFPMVSLLVRNMPLDDMERYGRAKDLLPIFLSAVNVKLNSIETQTALRQQNHDMLNSFKDIRQNLFDMGSTVIDNREGSKTITDKLIQELHSDLLRMGLEEDQEDYLVERIDEVINEVMLKLDAGAEIRIVLSFILKKLKSLVEKQETLLEEFKQNVAEEATAYKEEIDDSIELF